MDVQRMLAVALEEARAGLSEGGIPIGAALFSRDGELLGRGHNRRVQHGDPSAHGETDAFRNAGRRRSYGDTVMATTLAPCWYCSGLIRQFGIWIATAVARSSTAPKSVVTFPPEPKVGSSAPSAAPEGAAVASCTMVAVSAMSTPDRRTVRRPVVVWWLLAFMS